jgi:phthiodiolone/phenolphthiodiolone dimycocerosates ketoreductase
VSSDDVHRNEATNKLHLCCKGVAMNIELGVPGQIMPPADKAVSLAQKSEAEGFDAVWWPDHLMGWHPDSVWTEDLTPLAKFQPNPHQYFDPLVMMGLVGSQLERMRVGVVVTDLIRRQPAVLAQTMLTLDHATKGKAILGLGSGERLNITPYGMPFDKPVGRLAEGIDIIRMLWDADGPIDFEGKFNVLDQAVLGLSPYGDHPPEIWTAAHGPRMLDLTGRKADGWLPTKATPTEYSSMLATIRAAGSEAGRDMENFTPGMLGYVLLGPDEATVERLKQQPLVRMLCVLLSSSVYRKLGVEPPLASDSGWHGFIPTTVPREESMRIIEAIPPKVVDYYAFCGTPEKVAEEVASFHDAGLRHLVMWNITAFGDPDLAGFSFKAMNQLRELLKDL